MADYGSDTALATLKDGKVPETRMGDAVTIQDFARRLLEQDDLRSRKRAMVNGLVDGNPPYKDHRLRDAGRADACNVNWGTGRTYCETGSGGYYDLSSEAPGIIAINTAHGKDDDERIEYSRIMSGEADRILRTDPVWDSEMQQSQWQMTLHGTGPLFFEDEYKVLPRSILPGDLRVPERTKAETEYWEAATIDVDYYPPDLYRFIVNEEAATLAGWDVKATKKAIENAMDIKQPDNRMLTWEFYQNELKSHSLNYYNDSMVCKLVHTFFREFPDKDTGQPGRVTHCLVERTSTTVGVTGFLFRKIGRFSSFQNCIHPMYFDRGNGAFHHSVTGLGTKMYAAMNYENRLFCRLMDGAFSPKLVFIPKTGEQTNKFQLTRLGDYATVPAGWEMQQAPVQGLLNDGLAMYNTSSNLMRSNLASYRQRVAPQQGGNPPTKFQKQLEAMDASALSKTTYNRYYKQLDLTYTEVVNRLCNLNSTDRRAIEFQKRCVEKGVPKECFGRIEEVQAVRVIGQGNPILRQEAVAALAPFVVRYPEEGQKRWLDDLTAATAGQAAVERYDPKSGKKPKVTTDQVLASLQVAAMRVGTPPVIESSQNPVTYAATFLNAATQAIQSIQKGGDPHAVLAFLDQAGPAILAHLQRFANDPTRKPIFDAILKQSQQLSEITDKLKKMVGQMAQQQQAQQQKTQGAMSDAQLAAMESQGKLAIKAAEAKHRMSLNDARVASDINRANRLAAFAQ